MQSLMVSALEPFSVPARRRLADPFRCTLVSRVMAPLEDPIQLHGTPEQLVSKPGFGTRFAAAAEGTTASASGHASARIETNTVGRTGTPLMSTSPPVATHLRPAPARARFARRACRHPAASSGPRGAAARDDR